MFASNLSAREKLSGKCTLAGKPEEEAVLPPGTISPPAVPGGVTSAEIGMHHGNSAPLTPCLKGNGEARVSAAGSRNLARKASHETTEPASSGDAGTSTYITFGAASISSLTSGFGKAAKCRTLEISSCTFGLTDRSLGCNRPCICRPAVASNRNISS